MRAILAAAALFAITFPALAADLGTDWTWKVIGHARVIDGDTIELERPHVSRNKTQSIRWEPQIV